MLLVSVLPQKAHAQLRPFETNFKQESWITAGLGVGTITARYVKGQQAGFSEEDLALLDPLQVNSFDKGALNLWNESLIKPSDVMLYGSVLIPLTLFSSKDIRNDWKDIGIIYLQTGLANSLVTDVIKMSVDRARPLAYNDDAPLEERLSHKARQSFVSGHTSQVASMTFLTAQIFSAYFPESKAKKWVWAGAVTYPAVVGYLRYRSGKHFPTDVIGGYIIGASLGLLIPHIHRNKESKSVSLNVGATGFRMVVGLNKASRPASLPN